MVTNDEFSPQANVVLDTLPTEPGDGRDVADPWGDVEIDDGPGVSSSPELAGKSQAELIAEIEKRDLAQREAAAKPDSSAMLANQFAAFLEAQKPKAGPVPDGYKVKQAPQQPMDPVSMERWKKQLAEKFLDDPTAATQEVIGREVAPLLMSMAESQAMLSRELVRMDPETRDIYGKFAAEIEADVAEITPMDKLKNPKIYHAAVERARARHFTELVSESTSAQQEAIAAKYLKDTLGLDLAALKGGKVSSPQPASSTLASPGRASPGPAPAQAKQRITLTAAQRVSVQQFADSRGVSMEAAAAHMKSKGLL